MKAQIETILSSCLGPVLDAEKTLHRRRLTIALLSLGAIGFGTLLVLAIHASWWSWAAVLGLLAALGFIALIGFWRINSKERSAREIARKVEAKHPELRSALLAAMDQEPDSNGELSYLQKELLGDVTEHAVKNKWVKEVSGKRLIGAAWGQFAALVAFCLTAWFLLGSVPDPNSVADKPAAPETPAEVSESQIAVTPGDVELEKGSRLIIEAKFSGKLPPTAMLVLESGKDVKSTQKIPMQGGLDDSVFSALIPSVDHDATYTIQFSENQSQAYAISTFEFPALTRADAAITPPLYLNEKKRVVEDTRKITVMEGATIEWRLQVNKALAAAELYSESGDSISLNPSPDDPTLLLASVSPVETTKYRVHLIDDKDRANRRPPWLTVNVKKNLPPKLELTFPGRDFEVTSIQELPFEAAVWDDVEIIEAGLTYEVNESSNELVLSSSALEGKKDHILAAQLELETMNLDPRDVITYHFWADDRDSGGEVRRSTSDLFFAEVRHFDQIIREQPPQQGEGQPNEATKLLELQTEVVNALWKLIRNFDFKKPFDTLASDIDVVQQSQLVAVTQAQQLMTEANEAELKQIYAEAIELMSGTATTLVTSLETSDGTLLRTAHKSALAARSKIVEARNREESLSMSKDAKGTSEFKQQRNMNLELKQKELKYEEESRAEQAQQTEEQTENLEVLTRLKDLARRQEVIAEKIKELQNMLQDANDEERAEIERQLKRLQEEQKELLRDVDELSERMDSDKNRPNMAEEKEKLDETRENIQDTSEELDAGNLAEAGNSATRAQEQLEEMKEEFRERTSERFSKEMEALRNSARQLAEAQTGLGESLEEMSQQTESERYSEESKQERGNLAREMNEQAARLEELLDELKTLSEQAEESEPLLSDALYESVREAMTSGAQESLEEARDLTFYNRADQAKAAEANAARGVDQLRESIEAAAEKVLGNEADALRLARSELDRLIEESKEESQRLAGAGNSDQEPAAGSGEKEAPGGTGSKPSETAEAESAPGQGGEGEEKGAGGEGGEIAEAGESSSPGEGKEPAGNGPGDTGKGGDSGEGQGAPGEQEGLASGPGESNGQVPTPGITEQPGSQSGQGGSSGMASNTGGDSENGLPTSPPQQALFFNQTSEKKAAGPISGDDYGEWSDRLSNVEEMIPQDDLRNEVAKVLDEARSMRIDFRRDNQPPTAATINERITNPLIELRQRVSEEIAKLNKENPIAPIDRDPVPGEFRDLVRRYYEQLGTGE